MFRQVSLVNINYEAGLLRTENTAESFLSPARKSTGLHNKLEIDYFFLLERDRPQAKMIPFASNNYDSLRKIVF